MCVFPLKWTGEAVTCVCHLFRRVASHLTDTLPGLLFRPTLLLLLLLSSQSVVFSSSQLDTREVLIIAKLVPLSRASFSLVRLFLSGPLVVCLQTSGSPVSPLTPLCVLLPPPQAGPLRLPQLLLSENQEAACPTYTQSADWLWQGWRRDRRGGQGTQGEEGGREL